MFILLLLSVTLATTSQHSDSDRPSRLPFDPKSVVDQLSHHPVRDGRLLVVNHQGYRVSADESGITLKPSRHNREAAELRIPVLGKPVTADGGILYRTEYGTVSFRGGRHGRRNRPNRASGGHGGSPLLPTGEFLIDNSLVYGPAEDDQVMPMVASDGTDYLVVWVDWGMDGAVCCARVSGAGVLLDQMPLTVDLDAEVEESPPTVTFDGVNYLITWCAYYEDTDRDVVCARVTPQGTLVDPDPILVRQRGDDQVGPAVCRGTTTCLVTWNDYDDGGVYGARVTQTGTVLDTGGILISSDGADWLPTGVAFDGTNWLVTWSEGGDIHGRRISQAGTVLDPTAIVICSATNSQYWPQATFGAGNFFVVWNDDRNPSPAYEDVYAARVTPAGAVLDPSGIAVSSAQYEQYFPWVIFDGTNYLACWQDYRDESDYRCARVSPEGVLLDPAGIVVYTGELEGESPCGAAHGSTNSLLGLFIYTDEGDGDIFGSRIDGAGTVLDPDPILVSRGTMGDGAPQVATDGTNYFAVWSSARPGTGSDIFGARVTAQGQVLDPQGIHVCAAAGYQGGPKVVYNGEGYVVAWQDYTAGGDIYACRVSSGGQVLDPGGLLVEHAEGYGNILGAVSDGSNVLIVWPASGYRVRGARVSRTGVVLDPAGITVMTGPSWFGGMGTLAYGGGCYLFGGHFYNPATSSSDIYAARVSQAGVPLDPTGIGVRVAAQDQYIGDIGFDGTNFLVSGEDFSSASIDLDIVGARVSPAGIVLDPSGIWITHKTGYQYGPRVKVGNGNFLVAWIDDFGGPQYGIYGARVSSAGALLDPAGIRVTAGPGVDGRLWDMVFDGTNWLVGWTAYAGGNEADVYCARISAAGVRTDSMTLAGGSGDQYYPALAHGAGSQVLTVYLGWTGLIGGQPANTRKTWGVMQGASGIPTGWSMKTPMPAGVKPIKDGGWLAYDGGTARIYASRGQKQPDFFAYAPNGDSWRARSPWLTGNEGKLPSKGSAGCADGNGVIYATKGNGTSGFWKYDATPNVWTQRKDVPLGLSNKKVKGGTDLAWAFKATVGSPYLLKGYKNEFYRYDVATDAWVTLTPAPVGSNAKWDKGSWLAYDDVNRKIYAFKAKYMELYRYSPDSDSWSAALAPMPLAGSTGSKKAKDGSCGTFFGGSIYALKGGGTTQYWKYTIATNAWAEKETIPVGTMKKKVKAGADIVSTGTALYATKGNKSNELWMYTPAAFVFEAPRHDGVEATSYIVHRTSFIVSPNPLASGLAVLRYSLPKDGAAKLRIYDVTGRSVLNQKLLVGRSGSASVDLSHLSTGIYLARLTLDDFSITQKLVVQR